MHAAVAEYFGSLPSPQRQIAHALHDIIVRHFPTWKPKIKWGNPQYGPDNKDLCYIFAAKDHVNLGFSFGSHLNDTKGRVEGTGKNLRHIKVKSIAEIDEPYFVDLLLQLDAIAL